MRFGSPGTASLGSGLDRAAAVEGVEVFHAGAARKVANGVLHVAELRRDVRW